MLENVNAQSTYMDVSNFEQGIYYLRISGTEGFQGVAKLVIK
jgi:hypothetical protein